MSFFGVEVTFIIRPPFQPAYRLAANSGFALKSLSLSPPTYSQSAVGALLTANPLVMPT